MGGERRGDSGSGRDRAGRAGSLLSRPHPRDGHPISRDRQAIGSSGHRRDRFSWRGLGHERAAGGAVCADRGGGGTERAAWGGEGQKEERRKQKAKRRKNYRAYHAG